jgi:hypothetical protein
LGVPRQARWLLVTALIVGGLVGLSLLALDRENVVWAGYEPRCPFCRHDVEWYSTRCPACDRDFDWTYAPDEDSPICTHCLAPGEDEHVRLRRKVLGEEAATKRVVDLLKVGPDAAAEYLKRFARGECGWCGGTGKDLAASQPDEVVPCAVCFGGRKCIVCAGDRRIRIGQEGADLAIRRYEALLASFGHEIQAPVERQREEVRRENERFLSRFAGASEARRLRYWRDFPTPEVPLPPSFGGGGREKVGDMAADRMRARIVEVLQALDAP